MSFVCTLSHPSRRERERRREKITPRRLTSLSSGLFFFYTQQALNIAHFLLLLANLLDSPFLLVSLVDYPSRRVVTFLVSLHSLSLSLSLFTHRDSIPTFYLVSLPSAAPLLPPPPLLLASLLVASAGRPSPAPPLCVCFFAPRVPLPFRHQLLLGFSIRKKTHSHSGIVANPALSLSSIILDQGRQQIPTQTHKISSHSAAERKIKPFRPAPQQISTLVSHLKTIRTPFYLANLSSSKASRLPPPLAPNPVP